MIGRSPAGSRQRPKRSHGTMSSSASPRLRGPNSPIDRMTTSIASAIKTKALIGLPGDMLPFPPRLVPHRSSGASIRCRTGRLVPAAVSQDNRLAGEPAGASSEPLVQTDGGADLRADPRWSSKATSPVHPVWWEAPSPRPVSPWKYS